jgi:inner membrane protein
MCGECSHKLALAGIGYDWPFEEAFCTMDSVTQFVLGAACVGALAPKHHMRKALIYGAALGTLPDLDALVPFSDPIDQLILHRSATHSLLVLPLVGWLIFTIARRFDQALQERRWAWFMGFQLALITHPILDFFTNYGTQLFWPLTRHPFGTGSVFIVDPIVTIPLLIASAVAWRRQTHLEKNAHRPLYIALSVAVSYLIFGLYTQAQTRTKVLASNPSFDDISIAAAPLTSLMHRVVLKQPGQYQEAYVSIFDGDAPIRWASFPSADAAITNIENTKNYQRLKRFSKGMVAARVQDGQVLINDLRMGSTPNYVFGFDFGPADEPFETVRQLPMRRPSAGALPWIIKRIYTPADQLPPAHEIQL